VAFPNTTLLQGVTTSGLNTTTSFSYTSQNAGLLGQATLAFGGALSWDYTNQGYPDGVYQPEVADRYTNDNAGQVLRYPFTHAAPVETTFVHGWTQLDDPDGRGEKVWSFQTDGTQSNAGLLLTLEKRLQPGQTTGETEETYTWAVDPAGNPYVGALTTTVDLNDGAEATKKFTQTLDGWGNVTQSQAYDWGGGTAPGSLVRTYTSTYLTDSGHAGVYLNDLLASTTVTDGANTVTLVSNGWDGSGPGPCGYYGMSLANPAGAAKMHDGTYGTAMTTRGLLTGRTTPNSSMCYSYDTTGTLIATVDTVGATTSITPDAATNSVPAMITPNSNTNLSTSVSYTAALSPVTVTAPNSATASTTYDAYGRPSTSTSVSGAVTSYSYTTAYPFTTTATVNGRWKQTVLDGLGRTVKVIEGDSGGARSEVDTVYGPCGCSPLGKVYQVSEPYDPQAGGATAWTSYVYDGLGRTYSVTAPDGSVTRYAYWGNVTQRTDPAGHWKQWAWGLQEVGTYPAVVREPNPAYPGDDTKDNWTNYSYDLMGHRTGVTMQTWVGSGYVSQSRAFNYNNTGYLQSETNPESGTVSYTYNSDGTLQTKTDAKSQRTVYTYDAYKRVTMIQRGTVTNGTFTEDVTQRTTYTWDTDSTGYAQNALGRLVSVSYQGNNGNVVPSNPVPNDVYVDYFSYTPGGEVAGKRFQATREVWDANLNSYLPAAIDLDQTYSYDNEVRLTQMAYPPEYTGTAQGQTPVAGPVYQVTYDSMGRPNGMSSSGTSVVNSVAYNAASQMTNVCYFGYCDTRSYNSMGQLVEIADPTVHYTYTYPAGANNGEISSQTNMFTGKTIRYTYDALDRLTGASSNQNWGTAYVYDGFGNLLQKNVTAGSAPTLAQNVNTATNQIVGASYDANGNQTTLYGTPAAYDAQNRMIQYNGGDHYAYNASNQRVWRSVNNSGTVTEEFYVYGVDGQRVGTYTLTFALNGNTAYASASVADYAVYFAGRLVGHGTPNDPPYSYGGGIAAVSTDQVGSVIDDKSFAPQVTDTYQQYYPWGEEKSGSSPNDRVKFATYRRDSESLLDYAWNRYYDNATGRYLTPDPYKGSADPWNPQSWNRYGYALGDPVGRNDPWGLCTINGVQYADGSSPCPDVTSVDVYGGASSPPTLYPIPWGGDPGPGYLIVRPGAGQGGGTAPCPATSYSTTSSTPPCLTPQQYQQSQCLSSFASSPAGQIIGFLSALDLITDFGHSYLDWTLLPAAKGAAIELVQYLSNEFGSTEFLSLTGASTSTTIAGESAILTAAVEAAAAPLSGAIPLATAVDAGVRQMCSQIPQLRFSSQ
jgi:RHS repeat-associated protein